MITVFPSDREAKRKVLLDAVDEVRDDASETAGAGQPGRWSTRE